MHVTSQTAPSEQVSVLPSPIVAEQLLALSHVTLADAPAVSVHVAPIAHWRFELSAAVTVQALPAPHCVSQEAPHAPVQDAPDAHESLQPCVAAWHWPVEPKLQVVLLGQVQAPPEHEGVAMGPASDGPPSEDSVPMMEGVAPLQPQTNSTRKLVAYLFMTNKWQVDRSRLRSSSLLGGEGASSSEWAREPPTVAAL